MDPTPTLTPIPSLAKAPDTGSILMLVAVLAFLIVAAYLTTRFVGGKANRFYRSKYIQIIDRLNISRDKSVMIVRTGDKHYMLGVTPQQISCIDMLEEASLTELTQDKAPMPAWMQRFFVPRNSNVRDDAAGGDRHAARGDELDDMERRIAARSERHRRALDEDKERGR